MIILFSSDPCTIQKLSFALKEADKQTEDKSRITNCSEINPLIDTIIDDNTICDIYNYIDKYYKYIDDIEIIDE